jgi:hypothetical protein
MKVETSINVNDIDIRIFSLEIRILVSKLMNIRVPQDWKISGPDKGLLVSEDGLCPIE